MGGDRYCGFCGKHETEVARLIAGPIANICNECVEMLHGMLHEGDPGRKRSLHEVLSRARQRRIAEIEAENADLRRERDDALLAAQIVRDLATPPISDADVEAAVAEAKRVKQEIEDESP